MILDELLVELGFEYDPEDLEKFKEDLGETIDQVKQLAFVVTGAAVAITGVAVASTAASDEQGKLADQIGITVEELDALQFAQQRAGGSADGMATSLEQLAIRASEAARGVGSGIEAFGILGISATDANGNLKGMTDLLVEVSKEFQGLDNAQQIELADKLGLRDSIMLLQQGPDAIRALTNEAQLLGVTTAEDAKLAAQFQDSLVDIWRIVTDLGRSLSRILVPVMQDFADTLTEWWKQNREIIQQNLPGFIEKLIVALKLLSAVIVVILGLKFINFLAALPMLITAATIALKGFLAGLLTIPALVAAAITAFALLAEDARGFFEGQESLIGDLIEKYPQWANILRGIASIFATIADLTEMIFTGWEKILGLDFSIAGITDFLGNLPGFLGSVTGLAPQNTVGATNNSTTNRSSNFEVGRVEISVNGSDNPEAVAQAVRDQFQQATQDLASAVEQ